MNLVLSGIGLALGLALWPIVLPVLILILIGAFIMTLLQPKPVRPVRKPLREYRVNYTVNGMRAAWTMLGRDEAHAIMQFQELVPHAKINLVTRDGEW